MKQNYKSLFVLVGILALANGCAVLTKSQVQEVKSFATAAEAYGTVPGEPVRIYAEVNRLDRIVNVSARNFSDPDAQAAGWDELKTANEMNESFREVADKMDRTLEVYSTYSQLLLAVCSNEYTDSLQNSAKKLGQKMDKAIGEYNEVVRTPAGKPGLGALGGMVAAVVRGGGGIYIRYQQAKILKEAITTAQPTITNMMIDVRELITQTIEPELNILESRFERDFKTASGRAKQISAENLLLVANTQQKLDSARKLCVAAGVAADKFAAAHTELTEKIRQRLTLKEGIAEIQALADEIKAAQKLKKDLAK